MNYLFQLKRIRPKPIFKIRKRIIYNPNPTKQYEDYESGFSFSKTKRLQYVDIVVGDDLEF
jgi:hypothetical protein